MSELNYQHLRYFWAVARDGNLTRAAARLHVTQSAVSVQLRKLEQAMGQPLFDRVGRRLELTPAGRLALDYAELIFSTGEELVDALTEASGPAPRRLRVGALATLSRNFQMAFLAPVLDRPDVVLSITSGSAVDLVERLAAHQLDIVLTSAVPPRRDAGAWVAHPIDDQPVSLVGRPRRGRPPGLARLLAEEPVVVPSVDSGIRAGFDALVQRLGVRPRIAAEVDDMAMLRLVVRAHRGVGVVPSIVVHDELAQGTLVELHPLPDLVEHFVALTAPRRRPHPVVQELLGQLPHR